MSERWERVPVSREVRKALWEWAEAEPWVKTREYDQMTDDLKAAARQFREDVLADRRAEMRELDERSPMPGGVPE